MNTYSNTFKHFDSFNLFVFSRSHDNQTYFLLRKKNNSPGFTHFRGNYHNQEPSILLGLAKKFVRKTNGLLHTKNFQYFSKDNFLSFEPEAIHIESYSKFAKPARSLSPANDDLIRLVCESPYVFQDASNTVTYFIEIPMLDLEKLNDFAMSKELAHQFKYFSSREIMDSQGEGLSPRVREQICDGSELMEYIRKYIFDSTPIQITGSYGIICCEMFVRTHLTHALYYPSFKKHGEIWKVYKAYEKDLPSEEELKNLKGLIIPGSTCSVYNPHVDWYQDLFALIRNVHNQYAHIKMLGICFGAQAIAHVLGGKVEKMNRDFISGAEVLKVNPEFYDLPYVNNSKLEAAKQLVIAEAHNDHIVELPPMAKHYGSSNNTNVEIFGIGLNVLAFQGHPDYNEVAVVRSGLKNKNLNVRNYPKYEEACVKEKFPKMTTQKEILEICFNFLKQSL